MKKPNDKLDAIKESIKDSYEYFSPNYESYHYYTKFAFDTSMDDSFHSSSSAKDRPELEVNFCESFISQSLNYYFDQNPSLKISSEDIRDPKQVQVVEGIIRSILDEARINRVLYEGAREALSGGFSAFHLTTDYKNPYSMDQVIRLEKAFDPTLTYFDKKSSLSSKADAEYAGLLYLIPTDEFLIKFKDKVSDKSLDGMRFSSKVSLSNGRTNSRLNNSKVSSFEWSYSGGQTDFVLVARHYQKKMTKKKLVLLGGHPQYEGTSMLRSDFNILLEDWEYSNPFGELPPSVIKERDTFVTEVNSTLLYQNDILEEKTLPFSDIPLVYLDGNSVLLRKKGDGAVRQMTRPLIYHLTGLQMLRNVAASTIANDMENLQMSQLMVAKEALPQEDSYLDSYRDPQSADTIVYNARDKNGQPLPPPSPIPRTQTPQSVLDAFHSLDQAKAVLGNYQVDMANPQSGLSGRAITAGSKLSNAALAPYFYNFVEGALGQIARLCGRMIPIYYDTKRTVKVISPIGEMSYAKINEEGQPSMDYDKHGLDISIKPGPSNSLQRQESLETMMGLSRTFPYLSRFFGETKEGLQLILENIDVKGIDSVREAVEPFVQKIEQQNQMQMQVQQMELEKSKKMLQAQDPTLLKGQELQIRAKRDAEQAQLKQSQINLESVKAGSEMSIDKQNANTKEVEAITKRMKVTGDLGIDSQKVMMEGEKLQKEERQANIDALKATENLAREVF